MTKAKEKEKWYRWPRIQHRRWYQVKRYRTFPSEGRAVQNQLAITQSRASRAELPPLIYLHSHKVHYLLDSSLFLGLKRSSVTGGQKSWNTYRRVMHRLVLTWGTIPVRQQYHRLDWSDVRRYLLVMGSPPHIVCVCVI